MSEETTREPSSCAATGYATAAGWDAAKLGRFREWREDLSKVAGRYGIDPNALACVLSETRHDSWRDLFDWAESRDFLQCATWDWGQSHNKGMGDKID